MKHRIAAIFALAATALCPVLAVAQKVGVEVWMKGSDIETPQHSATRALRDSIEVAIGHASDLQLAAAKGGAIQILIPRDVIVARDDSVSYVLFSAEINARHLPSPTNVSGYCRYDELSSCSHKILASIRSALATGR